MGVFIPLLDFTQLWSKNRPWAWHRWDFASESVSRAHWIPTDVALAYGQAPQDGDCKLSQSSHLWSLETSVSFSNDKVGMFSDR
jgi:hypothetical protein